VIRLFSLTLRVRSDIYITQNLDHLRVVFYWDNKPSKKPLGLILSLTTANQRDERSIIMVTIGTKFKDARNTYEVFAIQGNTAAAVDLAGNVIELNLNAVEVFYD
jgi:hypothetical protein